MKKNDLVNEIMSILVKIEALGAPRPTVDLETTHKELMSKHREIRALYFNALVDRIVGTSVEDGQIFPEEAEGLTQDLKGQSLQYLEGRWALDLQEKVDSSMKHLSVTTNLEPQDNIEPLEPREDRDGPELLMTIGMTTDLESGMPQVDEQEHKARQQLIEDIASWRWKHDPQRRETFQAELSKQSTERLETLWARCCEVDTPENLELLVEHKALVDQCIQWLKDNKPQKFQALGEPARTLVKLQDMSALELKDRLRVHQEQGTEYLWPPHLQAFGQKLESVGLQPGERAQYLRAREVNGELHLWLVQNFYYESLQPRKVRQEAYELMGRVFRRVRGIPNTGVQFRRGGYLAIWGV